MKFGRIGTADAVGAVLGHGVATLTRRLKKGHVLTASDLADLSAAGLREIIGARLEKDDVPEDEAATRIAQAASGSGVRAAAAFTGRANLFAEVAGVAIIDRARVDRLNLIDEAVTIATLAPFEPVEPGQMLATIKIIPFAAPRRIVDAAEGLATEGGPLVGIAAFANRAVGLVITRLADTKPSIVDKTAAAVAQRVVALGSRLAGKIVCAHDESAVAQALRDLAQRGCSPILIFGASAIVDRRDVVPAGIVAAGGTIEHFGMPVDPGNLLLLGWLDGQPVVGVPGCARSPKLNGFDWVLQRLLAGIDVTRRDLMLMGAGGLLKEIAGRPMPRESNEPAVRAPRMPRIAAVVLAAGQSSRMGGANKLLADIEGQPMLLRSVDAVLASSARPVVVVTGHQDAAVRGALAGRAVGFVHNPDYAQGLSSSLRVGLNALPADVDGAVIYLGDMPRVPAEIVDKLIAAFNPMDGRAICVPTKGGKRGNPVLWAARFFAEMKTIAGDVGAKHLIGEHAELVREVATEDDGIFLDIDTPRALARLRDTVA